MDGESNPPPKLASVKSTGLVATTRAMESNAVNAMTAGAISPAPRSKRPKGKENNYEM